MSVVFMNSCVYSHLRSLYTCENGEGSRILWRNEKKKTKENIDLNIMGLLDPKEGQCRCMNCLVQCANP